MANSMGISAVAQQSKSRDDRDAVHEVTVTVDGQPARVFVGGRGERLLLIHGGWGGARTHWGPVFGALAERFQVIAPDLPGIGRTDQSALASVGAYAQWLDALLDALDVPNAWCVGNSFGASVACRFATDFRDRCRGLVLVNGFPMPRTPRVMRWLGERALGRRLVKLIEKRVAYTPSALQRAFVDPARAPEELRGLLHEASPPQLDAMANVLVQGGSSDECRIAPLLLWGEDDHLPGSNARSARKIHASWPGSTLTFVPGAGHMPQVERSDEFVEALTSYVAAHA